MMRALEDVYKRQVQGVPERAIHRPHPEELRRSQHPLAAGQGQRGHEPGQLEGGVTLQKRITQPFFVEIPCIAHILLECGLFQHEAGRAVLFRIRGRHGIQQVQASLLVANAVGQKGSGQGFAFRAHGFEPGKAFAKLHPQYVSGLCFIQMRMAIGRKINMGEATPCLLYTSRCV